MNTGTNAQDRRILLLAGLVLVCFLVAFYIILGVMEHIFPDPGYQDYPGS